MKLPADSLILFLKTRKPVETRDFYSRVMSSPVVLEQSGCWIHQVSKSGFVGFCDRDGVTDNPESVMITYVLDDVDAAYQRLLANGVEVDGEPRLNPTYGIYHFFAKDPNGYSIEVQRFKDPKESEVFSSKDG